MCIGTRNHTLKEKSFPSHYQPSISSSILVRFRAPGILLWILESLLALYCVHCAGNYRCYEFMHVVMLYPEDNILRLLFLFSWTYILLTVSSTILQESWVAVSHIYDHLCLEYSESLTDSQNFDHLWIFELTIYF